jgi:hypothetical protein
MLRRRVTYWLCALLLLMVVALGAASCGSTTTPAGPGTPTQSSGY